MVRVSVTVERGRLKLNIVLFLLRDPAEYASLYPFTGECKHPISEMLCFLVFKIMDDGQNPKNAAILNIIRHRQNPSE
jgi:hypothetical protein